MKNQIKTLALSRRQFLLGSGGIAIGVAFGVPALTASKKALAQGAGLAPNQWVTIATDGTITILSPASEMGQGTLTAMPLCLAEDLDADWSKVRAVQSPHNPKLFGNKMFNNIMVTGASRTTRGYYELLRLAGAQTRLILVNAAAEKWGVPATELTT